MPLPIISNTVRCAVTGKAPNGQVAVNVLHAEFTGGPAPSTSDINALATEIGKLYSTGYSGGSSWATAAHSSASVDQVLITPLDGTSPTTQHTIGTTGLITAVDPLPSQIALVFTLRTARRGRSYRGRQYWWGFTEQLNTTGGLANATTVGLLVAQWGGFIGTGGLQAHNWLLVVASYLHATAAAVTSVDCNVYFDRQNRRKQ